MLSAKVDKISIYYGTRSTFVVTEPETNTMCVVARAVTISVLHVTKEYTTTILLCYLFNLIKINYAFIQIHIFVFHLKQTN